MAQHYISCVEEPHYYENSGAVHFPIGELRRYHQEYQYDFNWVINEEDFAREYETEMKEAIKNKRERGRAKTCVSRYSSRHTSSGKQTSFSMPSEMETGTG